MIGAPKWLGYLDAARFLMWLYFNWIGGLGVDEAPVAQSLSEFSCQGSFLALA